MDMADGGGGGGRGALCVDEDAVDLEAALAEAALRKLAEAEVEGAHAALEPPSVVEEDECPCDDCDEDEDEGVGDGGGGSPAAVLEDSALNVS
eukprot:7348966-Prymnesium_polylepis.1